MVRDHAITSFYPEFGYFIFVKIKMDISIKPPACQAQAGAGFGALDTSACPRKPLCDKDLDWLVAPFGAGHWR
ncbi:MAG: hypothetical protein ACLGH2_08140, partial [Gammaproteobacteria bacterium]